MLTNPTPTGLLLAMSLACATAFAADPLPRPAEPVIPAAWTFQARLQRFSGSAAPVESTTIALAKPEPAQAVTFAGATWKVDCTLKPVADRPDAVDGVLTCRVTAGKATEVNAVLEFALPDWDGANFVLLPGAAYNGNRYLARKMGYPPIQNYPPDMGPKAQTVITDVPRLELDPALPSRLHLNTGDLTTPCLAFFAPAQQQACILLTDQGGVHGNHGLRVSEEAGRRNAVLALEAPCVRPVVYQNMSRDRASWDRGVSLGEGGELTIRFRMFRFPAKDVQGLYDRFLVVRKDLSGPVELAHIVPFSTAWQILEDKWNQRHWLADGLYKVGSLGSKYDVWQLGWVGGGQVTLPLLHRGSPLSRERAMQNLDWVFAKATSPAGMPYGIFNGRPLGDSHHSMDRTRWVMVRRLGDWLYFACKQIDLLKKQNPAWTPPAAWEKGLRRLADGLITVYAKEGQLGQYLDWDTWEIVVGGSTAGAMVPGGLALAGACFQEPRYTEAAARIARHFIERDLRAGVTLGGPGEVLQCPDSESAFALLESLVALYETSGDRAWLAPSQAMAAQCLTWCVSYDHRFPAGSPFGKLGIRATGSVWANVQNKHAAPAICTHSGDSLFKLWRATGNDLFLDQIRETAHNLPQYMSMNERRVLNMIGGICERVNLSDWEGRGGVGGSLFGDSSFPGVALMLTITEIPGIYVQPDTRRMVVFDHVQAEMLPPDPAQPGQHLRISNPTTYDAAVTVLVEDSRTARERPLGFNALHGAPVVTVGAGQTVVWTVPSASSKVRQS